MVDASLFLLLLLEKRKINCYNSLVARYATIGNSVCYNVIVSSEVVRHIMHALELTF